MTFDLTTILLMAWTIGGFILATHLPVKKNAFGQIGPLKVMFLTALSGPAVWLIVAVSFIMGIVFGLIAAFKD